jgi:3-phosphoshikimate 1-carboxyvinyltransferase
MKSAMRFISASVIDGQVDAPSSKSMMQRAVAAALLSAGETRIERPTYCDDARASIGVAEILGARIVKRSTDRLVMTGGLNPIGSELSCGESGLCLRMFTPIAALCRQEMSLTASGSLQSRPLPMVMKPLRDLGGECFCNGFPPITVRGPLCGGVTTVDGSLSSQFLSGLLFALPLVQSDSQLCVENLQSRPYIAMTLELLAHFGIVIENQGYRIFRIPGRQNYQGGTYMVEGDWSGAAFLLAAGAIAGRVCLRGLRADSRQGDRRILDALQACGAKVCWEDSSTLTVAHGALRAFDFDAADCPDLFPPLAVLACACSGQSRISGTEHLRHKESDRAEVLRSQLGALGADIRVERGVMLIRGGGLNGGTIDACGDHRIAMAAAVASLLAKEEVILLNPDCVSKSYPEFFSHFKTLGGGVHE